MSLRSVLRLIQVARPAPDDDCIGLGIFGYAGSNKAFVAECNNDLNIARFTEFVDFDKFAIESDIPPDIRALRFNIGDPIPIPYWVNGKLNFVRGDTRTSLDMPKEADDGVMSSVVGLLKDARAGRLKQRSAQWQSDYLRGANPDIFGRSPRDTRYWVARFSVVARELDWKDEQSSTLKNELQELSYIWLNRHLDNTSYTRLCIFLGVGGSPHIFGERRRRDIMYAFLVHVITTGRFSSVEKHVQDLEIRKMFPKGLMAAKVSHWSDLKLPKRDHQSIADSFVSYVRTAAEVDKWGTVERLAYLLYANRDMPRELQQPVLNYIENTAFDLQNRHPHGASYEIEHRRKQFNLTMRNNFDSVLSIYPNVDEVKSIIGILDGKQRMITMKYDSQEDVLIFERTFKNYLHDIFSRNRSD
ncbi:hypothetical protein ACXIUS_05605 [Bosea thiooxidans]|nr:hypothetical protein [Bosea sp. (in: a-proteobacteria)]